MAMLNNQRVYLNKLNEHEASIEGIRTTMKNSKQYQT